MADFTVSISVAVLGRLRLSAVVRIATKSALLASDGASCEVNSSIFFKLLGGHVGLVYMRSLPDPIRCKAPRFLRPFYGRQQHAAVRGLPRMKSPTRFVASDFRDADEQICRAS